jgi:hypothetical protein
MMSLAHFEGCQQVDDKYAIDVARAIALHDGDTQTLQYCLTYYDALLQHDKDTQIETVNKLKEYYKNNG